MPAAPPLLVEAMRYALLGGGKRVRPFLVLQAASICGAPSEPVLPAACAVEMVHAFSLVQDDLPCMDDDDLRRGRPSLHRVYGEAVALLAADALFALAFEILAESAADPRVGPERAATAVHELARAAGGAGMAGGQTLDLTIGAGEASIEELERMHYGKTGSLITASMRLGAILAGGDAARLEALTAVGFHLGLVYQIVDDLVDLPPGGGGDERLRRPSYARVLGRERAGLLAQEHARAAADALAPLGPAAAPLRELTEHVIGRRPWSVLEPVRPAAAEREG